MKGIMNILKKSYLSPCVSAALSIFLMANTTIAQLLVIDPKTIEIKGPLGSSQFHQPVSIKTSDNITNLKLTPGFLKETNFQKTKVWIKPSNIIISPTTYANLEKDRQVYFDVEIKSIPHIGTYKGHFQAEFTNKDGKKEVQKLSVSIEATTPESRLEIPNGKEPLVISGILGVSNFRTAVNLKATDTVTNLRFTPSTLKEQMHPGTVATAKILPVPSYT